MSHQCNSPCSVAEYTFFPLSEPASLVCNIDIAIFCLLSQPKDLGRINTRRQEYMDSLGTPGADRR